jgi:hypothetical protein
LARLFGNEPQRDPFVRLDSKGQDVRRDAAVLRTEERMRDLVEEDGDLGDSARHALSGAHVEGHAAPPPVVDEDPHGYVRLDARFGRDLGLLAVPEDVLSTHDATRVLAAHGVARDLARLHAAQAAEHLHFLVAHRVRRERNRRLHRGQAQELHRMVLDDVARHPVCS